MDESKLKVLRVTMEVDYYIEMHDAKRTLINGWTIEEIIEDWFKPNPLIPYHATRDAHEIGSSRRYIKSEIIEYSKDK